MVCSVEAETIDDRVNEMAETTKIRDGLWSYRGWYIRRISLRAQVSSDRTSPMYEIHNDLKELEECIGFQRVSDMSLAKKYIRDIIKEEENKK